MEVATRTMLAPFAQTSVTAFATITAMMIVLWLVGTARRDASIVDPFWGAGFVIVAWIACWLNAPIHGRSWLLAGLTTAWGLRLSALPALAQLAPRRRSPLRRDERASRPPFLVGEPAHRISAASRDSVVRVITASGRDGQWGARPWGALDGVGLLLWTTGMLFEAVGDWQLARFRADASNEVRVMNRGLWKYTRHPNYFGDFCVWWGLYLIAAAGGAWWTVGSPLLMSLLLIRVSGIALLETTIADRRPGYDEYQSRTNAFFPGPPRAI